MPEHVEHQHAGKRCLIPRHRCDFYLQYDRAEAAEAECARLLVAYNAQFDRAMAMEDRALAAEALAEKRLEMNIDMAARITAALDLHHPSQGMCETCGTEVPDA
jgi:hypothetical protein